MYCDVGPHPPRLIDGRGPREWALDILLDHEVHVVEWQSDAGGMVRHVRAENRQEVVQLESEPSLLVATPLAEALLRREVPRRVGVVPEDVVIFPC